MVTEVKTVSSNSRIDELKTKIKWLNSKAGQPKMGLNNLAEALPTDYEQLMEFANKTYNV